MGTGFEFDPEKSATNLQKHGIDFIAAQALWNDFHVIIPAKNVGGENRFAILGMISDVVYMAIFTRRRSHIRLISCHRADSKWRRIYDGFRKNEQDAD